MATFRVDRAGWVRYDEITSYVGYSQEGMSPMKIAVVYTGITPELKQMVEDTLTQRLEGRGIEILSYQNPDIIQEANARGRVTENCARRLMDLYEQSVQAGARVILNACSSVGEVAKAARPLYQWTGVRIVRIDEGMALDAARRFQRIGVVATLRSTMGPTMRLIAECAARQGRRAEAVEALADGAYGLNRAQFVERLISAGRKIADRVDALVFAQGSMAYAEQAVSEALGLPVLSSIGYGADAVLAAVTSLEGEERHGGFVGGANDGK